MILICLLYMCGVWIESVDPVAEFVSNKSSRVHDTSPRPRGCKNYPELPCELTEKLTGTAVRA